MNRRQLAFVVVFNAVISLVIALAVVWVVELRRPDPEQLAALYTPVAVPMIAATATPLPLANDAGESTSSQTPPDPTVTPVSEDSIYVVQVGDSLSGIAQRFDVAIADLVEWNKLSNPDFVFSGQRLIIPPRSGAAPAPTPTSTPIPSTNAGIRISVIGGAGDLANESLSLVNDSDLAVNLQGWRIENEGGPSYTFGNILLFPGSGLLLYSAAGNDTSVAVYWNQPDAVWQAGDAAKLINAEGAEISSLTVP